MCFVGDDGGSGNEGGQRKRIFSLFSFKSKKKEPLKRGKSMDIDPQPMIDRALQRQIAFKRGKDADEKAEVTEAGDKESTASGTGMPLTPFSVFPLS